MIGVSVNCFQKAKQTYQSPSICKQSTKMNDYYLFAMFAILITRKYDYFDVLKAITANNLCFLFCSFLAQTTILIIDYFQLNFPSKKLFFRTENDQQLPYVFSQAL